MTLTERLVQRLVMPELNVHQCLMPQLIVPRARMDPTLLLRRVSNAPSLTFVKIPGLWYPRRALRGIIALQILHYPPLVQSARSETVLCWVQRVTALSARVECIVTKRDSRIQLDTVHLVTSVVEDLLPDFRTLLTI